GSNPSLDGESFDIGAFAFVTTVTNIPAVQMSFDLGMTDADGDTTVTSDAINIKLAALSAPVIIAPNNLQYDPTRDDVTPFNRLMFADGDTTGNVTVHLTRTAGDGTLSASSAGGVTVGGSASDLTLT